MVTTEEGMYIGEVILREGQGEEGMAGMWKVQEGDMYQGREEEQLEVDMEGDSL